MRIFYFAMVELEAYNAPRVHTVEICQALHKMGHEVTLFVPQPRRKSFTFPFRVVYTPFFGFGRWRRVPFFIFSFFLLVKEAVKRRPDFLYERYCSTFLTSLFAKGFQVRHVLEINGPLEREKGRLLPFLEKKKIEGARGIVSSSPKLAPWLTQKLSRLEERVWHIGDGINAEKFSPRSKKKCRKELGLEEDAFLIGYTGLIYWAYEFHLVFQAMEELQCRCPKLRLLVVGPNNVLKAPKNVLFVESVPQDEVPLHINAFDLCLWPRSRDGLREWGVRSTKLHEYAACGKRVLVPKMEGEKPDPLLEPFLIYYTCGDEEDFKKKLLECYTNPKLCEQIDEKKRGAFVEKYSWEACGRKLERVLQKIAGGSPHQVALSS